VSNSEISEVAGVSRPTVLAWGGQFEKEGLVGFGEVAQGRGRKPSISDEKVAEIVELTNQKVRRTGRAGRWRNRLG
jgi:transposase